MPITRHHKYETANFPSKLQNTPNGYFAPPTIPPYALYICLRRTRNSSDTYLPACLDTSDVLTIYPFYGYTSFAAARTDDYIIFSCPANKSSSDVSATSRDGEEMFAAHHSERETVENGWFRSDIFPAMLEINNKCPQ
ncbi:unnamed protein product [Ceratitis capitata]|uniref:(Mediterranean fruit fly) hypothetical protein n=1 Tax=Ceratitis capitata TaxID=7213 RepID=A0A811UWJ4_CERCA|nr:unnamed protein product [Ceratitis capitata]